MNTPVETPDYVKVSDVMTPQVETVDRLATVADAIEVMRSQNYGALIIDRRDESDEYGVITVQGIAQKVIEPNLSPDRVQVYEIMEKPVVTIHRDMNIRYAIRLLDHLNQMRALVVGVHGKVIGIVTMYDMVMRYMQD